MALLQGKKLGLFFIALALLIVLWAGFILWVAQKVSDNFEQTIAAFKTQGYDVTYDNFTVSGRPFSVNIALNNFKIAFNQKNLQWSGPALNLDVSIFNRNKIRIELTGDHKFTSDLMDPNTISYAQCSQCTGILILNESQKPAILDAELPTLLTFKDQTTLPLAFYNTVLHTEHLDHWTKFHGSLKGMALGVDDILAIPQRNQALNFSTEIHLSGIPDTTPTPTSAQQWRDLGGIMDVKNLNINWPPMLIDSNGSLTYDENMLPLGSFTAYISSFQDVLQFLEQTRLITQKKAKVARYVLTLLNGDAPGVSQINIPITFQNGVVSVGPADLFSFKKPAPPAPAPAPATPVAPAAQ